jgi:hypothetical protein
MESVSNLGVPALAADVRHEGDIRLDALQPTDLVIGYLTQNNDTT